MNYLFILSTFLVPCEKHSDGTILGSILYRQTVVSDYDTPKRYLEVILALLLCYEKDDIRLILSTPKTN